MNLNDLRLDNVFSLGHACESLKPREPTEPSETYEVDEEGEEVIPRVKGTKRKPLGDQEKRRFALTLLALMGNLSYRDRHDVLVMAKYLNKEP